jgi:hypothetical protein
MSTADWPSGCGLSETGDPVTAIPTTLPFLSKRGPPLVPCAITVSTKSLISEKRPYLPDNFATSDESFSGTKMVFRCFESPSDKAVDGAPSE